MAVSVCPDRDAWEDLVDGRITDDSKGGLRLHLEGCERCRTFVEQLLSQKASMDPATLTDSASSVEMPTPMRQRTIDPTGISKAPTGGVEGSNFPPTS